MKRFELLLSSLAAGLLLPLGSDAAADHSAHHQTEVKPAESGQSATAGLVKKVDKNAGKATISHEPIENLGMPKMTMVFRVKDTAMLDQLKEGDKINFVADKVNGAFTVMRFEPAK